MNIAFSFALSSKLDDVSKTALEALVYEEIEVNPDDHTWAAGECVDEVLG